jgi:glucose-1-phosphate adenylyltransferase
MQESRLKLPRTMAYVLAGGRVGELSVLTLLRPKAAVPFGGNYRIIDFALSNLTEAGVPRIGIVPQYQPASLIDHIGAGQSWDLMSPGRGTKILPPFVGPETSHWYRGNADAVRQNLDFIRDHDPELVLVLSGDHVYHMDYRPLIRFHLERGADATVVLRAMGDEKDSRFGYGVLGGDGRLTDYREKPEVAPSDLASLTIYVFRRSVLEEVLLSSRQEDLEFGRHVVPSMLGSYRIFGWVFDGYWGYCRTPASYFQSNMDILQGVVDLEAWGIRTNVYDQGLARKPPARIETGSRIRGCLFSDGCVLAGTVENSILGPGVRVEKGAIVSDSLLFHDTVIEAGAEVHGAILDKRVRVGRGSRVGAPLETGRASEGDLTLLGKGVRVAAGDAVARGEAVATPETRGGRVRI